MPKKKPQAEFDGMEEESILSDLDLPLSGKQPRGKHRPNIRIPLTEEGVIDMARIKDPAVLERARVALGMPEGSVPEGVKVVEVPRQFVPWVYDGIAFAIGKLFQVAKFPKVMTPEERAQFIAGLKYSDKFKEEAKEPTGALLDKAMGKSKLAAWLMQHSDLAILAKMFSEETVAMVQRAAAPVIIARMQAEQVKNANGGFPASENRPTPYSSVGEQTDPITQ